MQISVTEVVRSFSDIIGRVFYKGESFEIKKGNQIVARIIPTQAQSSLKIDDLDDFFIRECHLGIDEAISFANDLKEFKASLGTIENPWD